MRELAHIDPDRNLLLFGSPLREEPAGQLAGEPAAAPPARYVVSPCVASHPEPRPLQCLDSLGRASDLDVGRVPPEQEQQ